MMQQQVDGSAEALEGYTYALESVLSTAAYVFHQHRCHEGSIQKTMYRK